MGRVRRRILNFNPQTADIHIHNLQLAHIVVSPDHFEQFIARKRLADVLHERLEQTVFDLRQLDLHTVLEHLAGTQIELERTGLDHVILGERRTGYAAVQRVHTSRQFNNRKRLGDIIVRTVHQTGYLIRFLRAGGQHDNARLIARAAHGAADLVAVDAGQHNIQHRNRDILIFMVLFQCYFAGFGLYYLVTAAFQVENQKGADILFIFQNQNFALHCNILLYF